MAVCARLHIRFNWIRAGYLCLCPTWLINGPFRAWSMARRWNTPSNRSMWMSAHHGTAYTIAVVMGTEWTPWASTMWFRISVTVYGILYRVCAKLRPGTIGFFKSLFFANANNGECEHVHCYNINSFSFSLQHQHQMISCDSSFHSNPILYLKCIYITYHICCIVVLSVNSYKFFWMVHWQYHWRQWPMSSDQTLYQI